MRPNPTGLPKSRGDFDRYAGGNISYEQRNVQVHIVGCGSLFGRDQAGVFVGVDYFEIRFNDRLQNPVEDGVGSSARDEGLSLRGNRRATVE